MIGYYDKQGQPIDMDTYCRLFEDFEYRLIARTELPGGCWVSTVWLGLDHSFMEGPPLIFESMVFPSAEDHTDLDCRRYATLEEAEAGHSDLVTIWTGWTPGDGHPEEAEPSFLTQFLNAMDVAFGNRPMTDAESLANDQMVVMYPKADGVADRLTLEGDEDGHHQGGQAGADQDPDQEPEEAPEDLPGGSGDLPTQDDRGARSSPG